MDHLQSFKRAILASLLCMKIVSWMLVLDRKKDQIMIDLVFSSIYFLSDTSLSSDAMKNAAAVARINTIKGAPVIRKLFILLNPPYNFFVLPFI